MGDLRWNEEAQWTQLYKGLSEEMKNDLLHYPDDGNTLAGYIVQDKNIDNWVRAGSEE